MSNGDKVTVILHYCDYRGDHSGVSGRHPMGDDIERVSARGDG